MQSEFFSAIIQCKFKTVYPNTFVLHMFSNSVLQISRNLPWKNLWGQKFTRNMIISLQLLKSICKNTFISMFLARFMNETSKYLSNSVLQISRNLPWKNLWGQKFTRNMIISLQLLKSICKNTFISMFLARFMNETPKYQ